MAMRLTVPGCACAAGTNPDSIAAATNNNAATADNAADHDSDIERHDQALRISAAVSMTARTILS